MHNNELIKKTIAVLIFLKLSEYEYRICGDFNTRSNNVMQSVLEREQMPAFTQNLANKFDLGELWDKSPREFFSDDNICYPVLFYCLEKLGSNVDSFQVALLGFMLKHKYPLDVIEWPDGFLNSNLKKSAKTLFKFNA